MSEPNTIPHWLKENPAESLRPPVVTRIQELPFAALTWKNFERLCYRLACTMANVERCRLYGNEGDDQEGIDIFARTSHTEKYIVYQCKREKDFGPQKIRDAVGEFLSGEWLEKSREFTLCTQESLQGRQRAEAFEEMAAKLRQHDVVLTPWDAPEINTLLKERHELVADFFGPAWATAFCGSQFEPQDTSQDKRAAYGHYAEWVSKVTSTYDVPGLSVSMSINDAWIELLAMTDEKDRRESKLAFEKALKNYHEWFRLGDDIRSGRISADGLSKSINRCAVIGGPGSGKSTLCKRLAHQSTTQGNLVALVRLKRVQKLMAAGNSFSDALALDATDGSGLSLKNARYLLSSAVVLIADGLDECDPQRSEIANKITDWSAGHPGVGIFVSTRPVGHHPNLLSDFRSFELLPLNVEAVEEHSLRLFERALGKEPETTRKWKAFCAELREDTKGGKSLASRNPLLLGFLVRLSVDGIEIGSNRCELFQQIFHLMAVNPRSNDSLPPEPEICHRVINAVGFQLVLDPMQTIDQLAANVSSQSGVVLKACDVRDAINFWEDRRAIERVSAGHLSAIVFVHPSLGEFSAARHVHTLDDIALDLWLGDSVRKPMWRQVVLLAAQLDSRILPKLIQRSDDNDLCSIEANIAAEAVAESCSLQKHVNLVSDALLVRISSANPLISIESALALQPIVKYWDATSNLLDEVLLNHEHEWTRLAALSLLIHTKSDAVLQHFEEWLQSFSYYGGISFLRPKELDTAPMPSEAGELQHNIIKVGLPALLEARISDQVEDYFRNGRDWGIGVSVNIFQTILSALAAAGFEDLAQYLNRDHKFSEPNFDNVNQTPALVDGIIAACGFESIETLKDKDSPLSWMQTIVAAIEMGQFPCSDGYYLRRRIGFPEFVEVLRGVIAAVAPNLDELKMELSIAKGRIADDGTLYMLYVSNLTKEPDWRLVSAANLDPLLLEKSLGHPHGAVRYGAACLLDGGAAKSELPEIVSRVLSAGDHDAVYYAAVLIRQAFPNDYRDQAVARLRSQLRPGFEHLVTVLFDGADNEFIRSLGDDVAKWLVHPDPHFVVHVVKDLKRHIADGGLQITDELVSAFEWWGTQGTWCREHKKPTLGNSCPECNLCIPSPKAELLTQLSEIQHFRCSDLLSFLCDKNSDVQRSAKTAILNVLRRDSESVPLVLDAIAAEVVPIQLLSDVSELPAIVLRPHLVAFEKLLLSTNEAVRKQAMHNLTGSWMTREEGIAWAEQFVAENEPSTVIAATRILRQLRNG